MIDFLNDSDDRFSCCADREPGSMIVAAQEVNLGEVADKLIDFQRLSQPDKLDSRIG